MDAKQLVQRNRVPDPYEPVVGLKLGEPDSRAWTDYSSPYRRRAEILAATRRLLAEDGCDRLMLKSVSDACSISTQTIHNIFGSKTELLTAAMNQHTLMIDCHALSQSEDPSVFLWLALAYCRGATERPEFVREFMHAAFSPKVALRETLLKFGADLKLQILRGLARRKLVRPFIDPRIAAEQIAYVNTFAMLAWAENDDIGQLYERMIHGNGAILLGILTPEAGREIENWLSGQFDPKSLLDAHRADASGRLPRPVGEG